MNMNGQKRFAKYCDSSRRSLDLRIEIEYVFYRVIIDNHAITTALSGLKYSYKIVKVRYFRDLYCCMKCNLFVKVSCA